MSEAAARAFLERIQVDEEFATRVSACKTREERHALVKQEGYEFTWEELEEVAQQELTEEQLDSVAGGLPYPSKNRPCSPGVHAPM